MKTMLDRKPLMDRMFVGGAFAIALLFFSVWNLNHACNDIACRINHSSEICNVDGTCADDCAFGCDSNYTQINKTQQASVGFGSNSGDFEEAIKEVIGATKSVDAKDTEKDKETTNNKGRNATIKEIVIRIINGLVSFTGAILWLTMYFFPKDRDGMREATS